MTYPSFRLMPRGKKRGSALLITMLVVAAISAAAFGLSRIFLADVRVSSSIEDSTKAYFAAEGGVEEGLVRYRIDKFNNTLNQIDPPGTTSPDSPASGAPSGADWRYEMYTYYLTVGDMSSQVNSAQAFDTIRENDDGNRDFPNGDVPQDESVETGTPNVDVNISWRWTGGSPNNRGLTPLTECGVEVTTVYPDGTFGKILIPPSALSYTNAFAGARTAVRVKPFCGRLDWLAFGAGQPLGRTIQTIESTGFVGRTKRKLLVTLNRRAGSIIGLFDFVLGSEGSLIKP